MIKKAVIAAAGRGTRFLPAVKSYSKEVVPILAKPNLQYIVEEIVAAGITQIAIVHRDEEETVKKYFTPDEKLEKYLESTGKTKYLDEFKNLLSKIEKFEFIIQDPNLPYGSASPAIAAKDFIGNDPFVYIYGDDLLVEDNPGKFLSQMISSFEKNNAFAIVGTQEVPWQEIYRYGSVEFKKDGIDNQIIGLQEKLPANLAPSNKVVFGRFIASPEIISDLTSQELSPDNELWWTEAINHRAKSNLVLNQTISEGEWMTTGDPLRWLKANIAIALKNKELSKDLSDFIKSKI